MKFVDKHNIYNIILPWSLTWNAKKYLLKQLWSPSHLSNEVISMLVSFIACYRIYNNFFQLFNFDIFEIDLRILQWATVFCFPLFYMLRELYCLPDLILNL